MRDEYIDSLGTAPSFFSVLFGSISNIATLNRRRGQSPQLKPESPALLPESPTDSNFSLQKSLDYILPNPHHAEQDSGFVSQHIMPGQFRHIEPDFTDDIDVTPRLKKQKDSGMILTFLLPDPGYFAAGGIAGVALGRFPGSSPASATLVGDDAADAGGHP